MGVFLYATHIPNDDATEDGGSVIQYPGMVILGVYMCDKSCPVRVSVALSREIAANLNCAMRRSRTFALTR